MSSIHGQYFEAEVLGADPVKLTTLLYRGALEAVGAARRHLANGEIRERSRRITQAYEIIFELWRALDHTAGGDMSRNLADLYLYMQSRLLEANAKQIDAPLGEVEKLLTTLADAWKAVPAQAAKAAPSPSTDADATEYTPLSCSF
jgi:flagellar protein FliS